MSRGPYGLVSQELRRGDLGELARGPDLDRDRTSQLVHLPQGLFDRRRRWPIASAAAPPTDRLPAWEPGMFEAHPFPVAREAARAGDVQGGRLPGWS